MMYGGVIASHGNSMVFAGYSEPILKKYSLDRGELLFSVNIIDDYDSSYNYVTSESGEYMSMGFSPGALYAVSGLDVIDDFIYTTNRHNGERNNNFIDVYSQSDGTYLESYSLVNYPVSAGLAVDGDYIYSIEMEADAQKYWLMKYNRKSL